MSELRGRLGLVVGAALLAMAAATLAGCKTTQCTGEDCDTCTDQEACCADGQCAECTEKKAAEEKK